jgi:single-strand DNA-binding protein
MPANLNKVQVIGNVTRDVDLKRTQGGTAVCDIGIAVNENRKDANGQWQEETLFLDVTLWGRNAEIADEYAGKGASVYIEGRMRLEAWTDPNGYERKKLKIIGDRLQLLGGRSEAKQRPTPAPAAVAKAPMADDFPF